MAASIRQSLFVQQAARLSRNTAREAPRLPLAILCGVALLTACSKPVEPVPVVRPVRAMTLEAEKADVIARFSGDIQPRIEPQLAFRVGGKIIARKVEVGTTVQRGQVLMQLDAQDLKLAQAQASAGLEAAQNSRDLALAELRRARELYAQKFVSQAVLDTRESAFNAAQASYEEALAAFRRQSNQADYTTLVASSDGVITGIDAEVGQVVAAGMPVIRLAQTAEKEVEIGIPEGKLDLVHEANEVQVSTWTRPEQHFSGKIRQISPVADPATRTYTARISIPDAPEHMRLGMTAYVTFMEPRPEDLVKLPLTALFNEQQGSAVWVVEDGHVRLTPVKVVDASGNEILVSGGVSSGQVVVTAGVNMLEPGQQVTILDAGSGAAGSPDSTDGGTEGRGGENQ